jgi:putative N6-adenine-specific DNA methylase
MRPSGENILSIQALCLTSVTTTCHYTLCLSFSSGYVVPTETFFAVTAPGLEEITAKEIQALGYKTTIEPGGVTFSGDREGLYKANLHLRTASRILLRVADFEARAFYELERHARRVPWEKFLLPGKFVGFRVSCHKSKLYHSDAVKGRFEAAILKESPGVQLQQKKVEEDEDEDTKDVQLFFVRFEHDRCTVSIDTSGKLLHLRGYRQAIARAPLRETIAAAMVIASKWDQAAPLLDPMCGSGTIPIEAALLSRCIPPGLSCVDAPRSYAFQEWPDYDAALWQKVIDLAKEQILPKAPAHIFGSDQSTGAIEAAKSNAARAGVLEDIQFFSKPLADLIPPKEKGVLITNPPYGVRVGNLQNIRAVYQELGRVSRAQLAGWSLAILAPNPQLESQIGFQFTETLRVRNGGIPVRLITTRVLRRR